MTSSTSFILLLLAIDTCTGSSFQGLRAHSMMGGGASLSPVSVLEPSWAPAELPSVKQMGSWRAKVDEEVVAS